MAPDKRGSQSEVLVGRAGLKLAAALDRFGLGARVAGARAVDVGASTGGFTQILLERGAASVLAVDVGHGQLHERLRRDERVTSLEGVDWKRLALSIAPGPFDFFTVDVSFTAARTMLRSLAFRLRDGAEGVVLVKPQFELPDHLVRGGNVTDPGARQLALARFTTKAEALGFVVLAHADSPVAGGEGTIEILTHVRFAGRSAQLPRPGERREGVAPAEPGTGGARQGRKAGGRGGAPLGGTQRWFAVVTPGAEEVAAREAARLPGAARVQAVAGGVELEGPLELGMRANLHLRVPTRLLLRLGEARAREFGKLRHRLATLPWEAFVPAGAAVRISATATHCRLYHTGALDETVRAAIGDRTGTIPEKAATTATAAPLILVRGVDDVWTISVDSSGERLHRRGWRTDSGEAPLRETLAAALLALSAWEPGQALVDPMCGAGTIPIEACTAGLGIAPGLHRGFAFEAWPGIDAAARARWDDARRVAAAARRDTLAAPIVATDHDARAVATARDNAARAGVGDHVRPEERPLSAAEAPATTGLFIANPPYGERLGKKRELPALYREIGRVLTLRFRGWRATVVVPDARLASAFRIPVASSHRLFHGGLSVTALGFAP